MVSIARGMCGAYHAGADNRDLLLPDIVLLRRRRRCLARCAADRARWLKQPAARPGDRPKGQAVNLQSRQPIPFIGGEVGII